MMSWILAAAWAADPAPVRDQVDWPSVHLETRETLAKYLQIDTRNPPGHERLGAEFLTAILDREGIPWKIYGEDPERPNLVARLTATDPKQSPLCLMHHLDVVGWEEAGWADETGPLSGTVKDGFLWGRGALDMKGMGILELQTLLLLKRMELPLDRDVILLAVSDEEIQNTGAETLAKSWAEIGCSHMINEGGFGVDGGLFTGQVLHGISVAEKGVLWFDLVANGAPGHGSTPRPGEAPTTLLAAVDRLESEPSRHRLTPTTKAFFRAIGEHKGGFTGSVLKNPALLRMFAWKKLLANPAAKAMLTDTRHVTALHADGGSPNVVPSEARATFDMRLLPGVSPEDAKHSVERRLEGYGVRVEVRQQLTGNGSPQDDPLFRAIAKYAVEGEPRAVAAPMLSIGFTDSIVLREKGVHAYGYIPFVIDRDLLGSMHGDNERVPLSELERGLIRLFSIVVDQAVRGE